MVNDQHPKSWDVPHVLTGIPTSPACNSANAPMCGASATRLASHKSRKELAAGRHSAASGRAATTYEIAFINRDGLDVGMCVLLCVVNHDAYVPVRQSHERS